MKEKESGFPFLEIPQRPTKPRKNWVTVMSDRGLPPGYQRDFLRLAHEIVDYAKWTDHPGTLSSYPRELLEEKLSIYKSYGIPSFLGGIPFEVALMQGKVGDFFKRLVQLGFQAVEISEDVVPQPMTPEERKRCIQQARELGLEVFTELGRKFPEAPLEKSEVMASAREDLQAGVSKVVIEKSEILLLRHNNPAFLPEVARALGKEHLIFEAGPGEWPTLAAWLIKNLGPDVNIENISDKEIIDLDAMRRQLSRDIGYTFFRRT